MQRSRLAGAVLVALLTVPPGALHAQQTFRLTPSDGRVAIWNLVGAARIEQGTSSEVEVTLTARGADAGRMITRTGLLDGQQTLRIYYPVDEIRPAGSDTRRRSRSSSSFRMRDDGRFGGNWNAGRRMKVWDGADFEASADLVIRVPANVALDLHLAVGNVTATGASRGLTIDTHSGSVQTADTRGPLDIDTGSGAVEVKLHAGDLLVDTGSGDVDVSDVTGARTISLDTGSGTVLVDDCVASGSLKVDTGSGRIVANRIEAPDMTLDTGSGSVEVAPTAAAGSLHVDTGSGSVTLLAPSNFSAELEISAGSGGIRSDVPLDAVRRSGGEMSARIGTGRSRVSIDTGSGGVTIRSRLRTI